MKLGIRTRGVLRTIMQLMKCPKEHETRQDGSVRYAIGEQHPKKRVIRLSPSELTPRKGDSPGVCHNIYAPKDANGPKRCDTGRSRASNRDIKDAHKFLGCGPVRFGWQSAKMGRQWVSPSLPRSSACVESCQRTFTSGRSSVCRQTGCIYM